MLDQLSLFLFILSVIVVAWGFERYRTQFVKTELILSLIIATGLNTVVFIPALFDMIGTLLDIDRRYLTISLLANVLFIGIAFYLAATIRETRNDVSELVRNLSVEQAASNELRVDGGEQPISIVIPAYNESETIQTVVQSLPETIQGHIVDPIVVSDGSQDDTAARADRTGVTVVEHLLNQGQGGAIKTGFDVAIKHNAKVVVTMDGDGQHPAEELDRLVSPVLDADADFVMGSRLLGTDYSGNSVVRQAGIHTFTRIINVLTKTEITDCTNGYRAIRGSAVEQLTLTEERFSAPELIIEARKNGLRIQEIPITIEERQAGETKKPQLGYAIGLTRTILMTWIR